MYRVLDCIRYEHDYRLVLLAVAICALTSWMAWYLYALSSKSSGLSRWAWILQTAVATGSGIWATHFIAMLAFKSALPTTYEPLLTLTSLLIAICVSGAGFCIAEGNRPTWIYLLAGTVVGEASRLRAYPLERSLGHRLYRGRNHSDCGCDVVLQGSEFKIARRKPIHGSGLHIAFHGHGSRDGGI